MKDISQLYKVITLKAEKITDNVLKAHENSVEKVYQDVKDNVPDYYPHYKSTIKKYPTEKTNNEIKTIIGTEYKSDGYFVGRIIEHGTGIYAEQQHIGHTELFKMSGYSRWLVPKEIVIDKPPELKDTPGGKYYIARPSQPKPHFKIALENNKTLYKENVRKAIKEGLK